MGKVVSVVPKLITSTLGMAAAAPPKPVLVTAPAPEPVKTDTAEVKTDDTITGPDLADDLGSIETRNRGRLGTITTSFRGVLTDGAANLSRRTLLGE